MIKISMGEVISFRNTNYKVIEIVPSFTKVDVVGEMVSVAAEKKIDINTKIEIDDEIMRGWEREYRLLSVEGRVKYYNEPTLLTPHVSVKRLLTFHFI